LFARRELAIVALYLLGYVEEPISRGLGLGRSQVQESTLLRQVRAFVRVARVSAIRALVSELQDKQARWGRVSLDRVAQRFDLSRRQVERILRTRSDPDDLRLAVEFTERLGEQPREVRQFVQKSLFYWLYPRVAQAEARPFDFFGIPLLRDLDETYHSWLHENDVRKLHELAPRYPPMIARYGSEAARRCWFIPGRSGVLPPALWAVLNQELFEAP